LFCRAQPEPADLGGKISPFSRVEVAEICSAGRVEIHELAGVQHQVLVDLGLVLAAALRLASTHEHTQTANKDQK
jgi:hypothetical protein